MESRFEGTVEWLLRRMKDEDKRGTKWRTTARDNGAHGNPPAFSQSRQSLLVNMEKPLLERLCDLIIHYPVKSDLIQRALPRPQCGAQHLAGAVNECRLMPSPNGIALCRSSLLWHGLSSGQKITTKIRRENKPADVHDRQPGLQITH